MSTIELVHMRARLRCAGARLIFDTGWQPDMPPLLLSAPVHTLHLTCIPCTPRTDHDLDQIDHVDQIYRVDLNLPLLGSVQDLYITDPTQKTCPALDRAESMAPTRQRELQ